MRIYFFRPNLCRFAQPFHGIPNVAAVQCPPPAGNKNWSILDSTLPGIVQQISAQLLWYQYDTAFPLIACNCSSKTGRFHRDIGKFTYPNSSRTNCLNRQVEPHIPIPSGCLQQAEVFGLAQLFFLIAEGLPLYLKRLDAAVPGPLEA